MSKANITIENTTEGDFENIAKLNHELVHFLSPMDISKLERMDKEAAMSKVIKVDGEFAAFLIAFDENANYDSVNYQWFKKNYERFLYVDRIVVNSKSQGQKLGEKIYEKVFEKAAEIGVPYVTAEIDIKPANPVSLGFHEKMGFKQVGTQKVGEIKEVSLQAKEIL